MARAWLVDEWFKSGTDDAGARVKVASAKHGKGSRWRVNWYEVQPTGERVLRGRSFPTKTLAEDFKAKTENDIRAGSYRPIEHSRKTFASVAETWLTSKQRVSGSTRHAYQQDLKGWILPRWGGRQIGTIVPHEVEGWTAELRAHGLSPATITRLHTVTSSVLGYAQRQGWIATNPARGVELPQPQPAEHVYLDFSEIEALAGAAGSPTNRALVLTLAYTGLRINEALALRVGDLDLPRRRARIARAWTVDGDGRRVLDTPKGKTARVVPIPGFLEAELRPLVEDEPAASFVFRGPRGGAIHAANWRNRDWRDAVLGSGLDGIGLTPHKLRHTAASMAIAAGADVKLVQAMLGHKDATETLNTYGHLWPDRLDEVTDAVERARERALREP